MNNTAPINQASAIRWLLEKRRSDVSFAEAIRRIRLALHGDAKAQSILDELVRSGPAQ